MTKIRCRCRKCGWEIASDAKEAPEFECPQCKEPKAFDKVGLWDKSDRRLSDEK